MMPGERSEPVSPETASSSMTYYEEKLNGVRNPNGSAKLKKLSGKQLRIVNLHINGVKGGQIAETMRMSPGRISNILNDPSVKEVIRQRFEDVDNETFAKSVLVVRASLEDEDHALRLRAADMVWRARGRYEKKFDDRPTAEDVVQKMLAMAKENGSASVTISANVGEGEGSPSRPSRPSRSFPPAFDPLLLDGD